jgi:spore maturation protein CgeB
LKALEQAGIKVHVTGGQREERVAPEMYAEIMQRSKIVLNWSGNRDKQQLKGRIFEATLCGAMLMESSNDEIVRYFAPYEEYVPFDSNTDDLVYKVSKYLKHEEDRLRVATAGYKRATKEYNAHRWWQKVFDRCGIPIVTEEVAAQ